MAMLAVYVTPKAPRDQIAGWRGTELGVRVTAAPEDGRATAAVCALVAKAVGVPKSSVSVVRGAVARHKLLEIEGVTEDELRDAFGEPDASLF